MKKFLAILMSLTVVFSAIGVSAASVPKFMEATYNNYTADYKFNMSISNADELVDFLGELEITDKVDKYIDVKALIKSLCSVSSVMNVQAEASSDFRRMKAAITSETSQNIVFNTNFDTSYRAKSGIWMEMDIDKKKLVLIYSTPMNNKYAVIDFAKDFPAEVTEPVFSLYDSIFNAEFMKKNNKEIMSIAAKYADISLKGNKCTVTYDNDSFVALVDELIDYIGKLSSDMAAYTGDEITPFGDIPSLEGIKLLGDEGIVCRYNLSGTRIKSVSEKWDISIDIADIFTKLTGMSWDYEYSGKLDFKLEASANVTRVGTTRVSMPKLTEDNSFSIVEMIEADYDDYEITEDYETFYVNPYVWNHMETDTFDGERYYMPLRASIEEAYMETSVITYDNGFVTITTDCGDASKDINVSLRVGEDTATVNGTFYESLGAFKNIDGSVYASVDFYEKCLGWTLESLQKDILSGALYYDFYTSQYEEY